MSLKNDCKSQIKNKNFLWIQRIIEILFKGSEEFVDFSIKINSFKNAVNNRNILYTKEVKNHVTIGIHVIFHTMFELQTHIQVDTG